jgi:hypothetical protein
MAIEGALYESASVADIGADSGSYEPTQTVVAVEPSKVMIAQRGLNAAPAIQAIAEQLPIRSKGGGYRASFDRQPTGHKDHPPGVRD